MRLAAAGLAAVTGLALFFVPGDDSRLFSISEGHGPSAVEALGAVLLAAASAVVVGEAWRRRSLVAARAGRRATMAGAFAVGLGAGLLVASIFREHDWWWVPGVSLLVLVQLAALVYALR